MFSCGHEVSLQDRRLAPTYVYFSVKYRPYFMGFMVSSHFSYRDKLLTSTNFQESIFRVSNFMRLALFYFYVHQKL